MSINYLLTQFSRGPDFTQPGLAPPALCVLVL